MKRLACMACAAGLLCSCYLRITHTPEPPPTPSPATDAQPPAAMHQLDELQWRPLWVSHLGCIKGCADYTGHEVSTPWLFGITGHGFIMNIHEVLCPSGPTAWRCERVPILCANAGLDIERVSGHKSMSDFAARQSQAWDMVRAAIDEDVACYGWELAVPEFYIIYGYDDTGYYFQGPLAEEGQGPKVWSELADTGIGWLEVGAVRAGTPAADADAVREGLEFALAFADPATSAQYSDYATGLAAYDAWITALEDEKAEGFGTAYNAEVWSECRAMARDFLKEARRRLGSEYYELCDDAIAQYTVVADELRAVRDLFPFQDTSDEQKDVHINDAERRMDAIAHLKNARAAEDKGLQALQKLVDAL